MQDKRVPRTEAGVLQPGDLTEQQSAALSALMAYLRAIAEEQSADRTPTPRWRFLPRVDEKRRNHVFLINGKRGSGKSSVLLTLIDLCNRRLVEPEADLSDYGEAVGARSDEAPIVPVGLVDLQPIDPETNLLVHLVGQFKPLVEVLQHSLEEAPTPQEAPQTPARPAWLQPVELPSAEAWRRFMASAAAAWDANMNARKAGLDSEALIAEVEHTERYRLDVARRFKEFVDALVRDYRAWHARLAEGAAEGDDGDDPGGSEAGAAADTRPPLFVIAVDDADMNPGMANDLLDMLRMLWHERVAFVLTGDSDLFLDTLEDRLRWYSVIPTSGMSPMAASLRTRRRVPHAQLARNIYDKVIPEPHRLHLDELSPEQRVEVFFRVIMSAGLSLAEGIDMRQLQLEFSRFWSAIPGWLREIQNLGVALGHARPTMSDRLRVWLEHIGRDELRRGKIRYDMRGEDGHRLEIQAPDLVWQLSTFVDPLPGSVSGSVSGLAGDGDTPELWATIKFDLEFVPRDDAGQPGDGPGDRDDATPASPPSPLIALLELAAKAQLRGDDVVVHVGHKALHAPFWMGVSHRKPGHLVDWTIPRWKSWVDVHRATRRWLETVKVGSDQTTRSVSWYAHVYLGVIASTGDPDGQYAPPEQIDDDAWTALAQQVAALAGPDTPNALRSWARTQAGLMAAPEMGLPRTDANRWLRAYRAAMEEVTQWANIERDMRAVRDQYLAQDGDFRDWIEDNLGGYELFEGPRSAHITDGLQDALQQIDLPFVALLSDDNVTAHSSLFHALRALPVRLHNLSQARDKLQEHFAATLQPYGQVRGTSERAVLELLSTALARYPRYRDQLTLTRDERGQIINISLKHAMGKSREFQIGPDDRLVLRRAQYAKIEEFDDNIPPELDAIVRMLADIIIDGRDGAPDDDCAVALEPTWPYLTWYQGEHSYTLPVPGWRGLFDWELMQTSWNDLMDKLFPMELEHDLLMPQRVFVHLVYWYLDSMFDVLKSRYMTRQLSLEPGDLLWKQLGLQIKTFSLDTSDLLSKQSSNAEHSHRLAAFIKWAKRIRRLCVSRKHKLEDATTGSEYHLPPTIVEQLAPLLKRGEE